LGILPIYITDGINDTDTALTISASPRLFENSQREKRVRCASIR
jgi:hypothetical protein